MAPKGLTKAELAKLRAIAGLRSMITFDGAEITAAGHRVSVIGVNPVTFRSWVPLRTASDQAFWTALAGGDFVAASAEGQRLKLKPGASYRLDGASSQLVRFGLAARLDLAGVDLMVNEAESARLGLVRQVAGLISAPGVSIGTLTREVAKILGPSGRIEQLSGQLPAGAGTGWHGHRRHGHGHGPGRFSAVELPSAVQGIGRAVLPRPVLDGPRRHRPDRERGWHQRGAVERGRPRADAVPAVDLGSVGD